VSNDATWWQQGIVYKTNSDIPEHHFPARLLHLAGRDRYLDSAEQSLARAPTSIGSQQKRKPGACASSGGCHRRLCRSIFTS